MDSQLAKLHEILVELNRYEQIFTTQRVAFFEPLPKGDQHAFFEAQGTPVRLVFGSNRSGKSVVGCVEAVAHALGYRPWLPLDHPLRVVRLANGEPIPVPNVGRVIAQNYEQAIRQTIMPKFDEWMPRNFIKAVEKNTRGIPVRIILLNGSIIYFMSNDQDDMAFEGPNGHWVWADEPIDYRKFTGLRRGLIDYDGVMWMTMTPLSQPWIADVLVAQIGDHNSHVKQFKLSIWDNCVDRGGYLSREAITGFLKDLREDEYEARVNANFMHLTGRVYKTWEPQPPFYIPAFDIPESWPRVQLVDPHGHKPLALMWAACSPGNTWYIYRSSYDRGLRTVADAAGYIKHVEGWVDGKYRGSEAEPVALRIIDWCAEEEERTSGSSIRASFGSQGLLFVKAKKVNAAFGYDAIHTALKLSSEWSRPELVVFNTCPEVKQNFLSFCHAEWGSARQMELMGEKEGYRKVNDDFIDLIRYIYQHRLTYSALCGMLRTQRRLSDGSDVEDLHGSVFSTRIKVIQGAFG
jgi:hypothetical protein